MYNKKLLIFIITILISLLFYPKTYNVLSDLLHEITIRYKLTTCEAAQTFDAGNEINVIFMFDDGWSTVYEEAYPMFSEAGFIGNVGVVPTLVGEVDYMNKREIDDLLLNGWELLNHTYSHEELLFSEGAKLVDDFNKARAWMKNRNYSEGGKIAVVPYGQINPYSINRLKQMGYLSIRTSDNILKLNENDIKYINIRAINLLTELSVNEVLDMMELSLTDQLPIVFILHKVDESIDDYQMSYSPDKLQAIINYLTENKEKFAVTGYTQLLKE